MFSVVSPAQQSKQRIVILLVVTVLVIVVVKPVLRRALFIRFSEDGHLSISELVAVVVVSMISLFLLYAWGFKQAGLIRRGFLRSAEEILRRDSRPPVLFLRPFSADYRELPGLPAMFGYHTPMEAALIAAYARRGPGIAIARPGGDENELPPMGAYRMLLTTQSWQAEVAKLIDAAQIVVLLWDGTPSSGIIWELRHVLSSTAAHKLRIFVWPGRDYSEFIRIYLSCKDSLEDLVDIEALPSTVDADRPLVLSFVSPRHIVIRSYARIWYSLGVAWILAGVISLLDRKRPTPQPAPRLRPRPASESVPLLDSYQPRWEAM